MGGPKHPGSYGGTRKDHVLSEHRSRAEKWSFNSGGDSERTRACFVRPHFAPLAWTESTRPDSVLWYARPGGKPKANEFACESSRALVCAQRRSRGCGLSVQDCDHSC